MVESTIETTIFEHIGVFLDLYWIRFFFLLLRSDSRRSSDSGLVLQGGGGGVEKEKQGVLGREEIGLMEG